MAKLYSDNTGVLLRLNGNDAQETQYGAPAGAANNLSFDEDTNQSVIANIIADWNNHRLVGSTLTRSGVTVVIAADGQDRSDYLQAQSLLTNLNTYYNTASGSITNAMSITAIKALIQLVRLLIRRLIAKGLLP